MTMIARRPALEMLLLIVAVMREPVLVGIANIPDPEEPDGVDVAIVQVFGAEI